MKSEEFTSRSPASLRPSGIMVAFYKESVWQAETRNTAGIVTVCLRLPIRRDWVYFVHGWKPKWQQPPIRNPVMRQVACDSRLVFIVGSKRFHNWWVSCRNSLAAYSKALRGHGSRINSSWKQLKHRRMVPLIGQNQNRSKSLAYVCITQNDNQPVTSLRVLMHINAEQRLRTAVREL